VKLLIFASQVAGITDIYHHAKQCLTPTSVPQGEVDPYHLFHKEINYYDLGSIEINALLPPKKYSPGSDQVSIERIC
jgi:hypothetical protein